MSGSEEAVVRRFYEQMNNERKNDLAHELFAADHRLHDPQSSTEDGPNGVAGRERIYLDRFWNELSVDPKRFDEAKRGQIPRRWLRRIAD